jgi:membrane-associated protein
MDLPELLGLIERYDTWIYSLILAYALGKTGPLPMLAGYAAAQGALRAEWVLLAALAGSVVGGQLRFAVGRFASPWVCRTFPNFSPWLALASAGVERFSLRVLLVYRFVKGTFSVVGVGGGASLLAWPRYAGLDAAGALLWVSTMLGIGWAFGQLQVSLDPRWAAYVGLGLLLVSMVALALGGRQLKAQLLPIAQRILAQRAKTSTTSSTLEPELPSLGLSPTHHQSPK